MLPRIATVVGVLLLADHPAQSHSDTRRADSAVLLATDSVAGGGGTRAARVSTGVSAKGETSTLGNCDLTVEGPVCLMQGQRVLLPHASPEGLGGRWSFDDAWPLDSSGNSLHSRTLATAGIGVAHSGYSGSFDRSGKQFHPVEVKDEHGQLLSTDATVSFWMYVIRPPPTSTSSTVDCAIIYKGNLSQPNDIGNPAVYLNSERRISFAADDVLQHSQARIAPGRWTHIAVTRTAAQASLYVNGVVDRTIAQTSTPKTTKDTLYLGGVPLGSHLASEGNGDACARVYVLLDEVQFHTIARPGWAIEAEASPALGGISPSFVRHACTSCTRADAADACSASKMANYHLCSETELYSGALQVARTLGYVETNTARVWRSSDDAIGDSTGVGLCCINS